MVTRSKRYSTATQPGCASDLPAGPGSNRSCLFPAIRTLPPMRAVSRRAARSRSPIKARRCGGSRRWGSFQPGLPSVGTSLLEPVLLVFLAVVVGSIVIAMFLPLAGILNNGFDRREPGDVEGTGTL